MTMSNPVPRRPVLADLRASLADAHTALRTARDELRDAAARHAGHNPNVALALAQIAAGVDTIAAKVPPRWPQPVTTDMWLVEADRLHATVTKARLGLWRLSAAADRDRPRVPVPDALVVRDGDAGLFGRAPREEADGWTDPQDLWDLHEMALTVGSDAWLRRAVLVEAADGWARECQDVAEVSGVHPLRDGSMGLTSVLSGICTAAIETRAKLMPGIRAKTRIAARALVEADDDSTDLAALARDHAVERGPDALDALAWAAMANLLELEAQR